MKNLWNIAFIFYKNRRKSRQQALPLLDKRCQAFFFCQLDASLQNHARDGGLVHVSALAEGLDRMPRGHAHADGEFFVEVGLMGFHDCSLGRDWPSVRVCRFFSQIFLYIDYFAWRFALKVPRF